MPDSENRWTVKDAKTAVLALMTPQTIEGALNLQRYHALSRIVTGLIPLASGLSNSMLDEELEKSLRDRNLHAASRQANADYQSQRTAKEIFLQESLPYPALSALLELNIVTVGAGPGSLIPTGQIARFTNQPDNIQLIDTSGKIGGMWKNASGAGSVFNNPPLKIGKVEINGDRDGRTNETMMLFLRTLASPILKRVIKGDVTHIEVGRNNLTADYHTVDKDRINRVYGNVIIASPGNHPRPVESTKMASNAAYFEEKLERWQRPFSKEEAIKLNGKTIVIVGWGNSARKQWEFIQEANQKYDVNINYVILTHFTSEGLLQPENYAFRADGTADRVARDLENGLTTNFELDIPSSRKDYWEIIACSNFMGSEKVNDELKGFIPSVTAWHIFKDDYGNLYIAVNISTQREGKKKGGLKRIKNVGKVFLLNGYHVPPEKLESLGFQINSEGAPAIRYSDGAALDQSGEIIPNLYLTGFASADQVQAPSVGTLPGMTVRTAHMMLSQILWGSTLEINPALKSDILSE